MGDMDTGRIGHSVKVEHCHALQEDGLIGKPVLEKAGQIQCRGSISPLQLYFITREIGASSNEDGNLVPQRGKSMMPFLTAQAESIREQDEYLAWEFFDWNAVRTARWKASCSIPGRPSLLSRFLL